MFDNIAHRYDFLNRTLSVGIDNIWRRKAIAQFKDRSRTSFLDIATGTGDLAIEINRQFPSAHIEGMDLSPEMIKYGIEKLAKKGLTNIKLSTGDAENLVYKDNNFSGATVAFGVRNFENLQVGLKEIWRVLEPGGRLVVLEFSTPRGFIFKPLFQFYFKNILPKLGKFLSKDPEAYDYLFRSVQDFPAYEEFMEELTKAGFTALHYKSLTFGVCCIYVADK